MPAVVLKTSKTYVLSHYMLHLVLSYGRELIASPDHLLIDGRKVKDLSINQPYDGAYVVSKNLIPYKDEFTYDILPNEETGFYWANGILIGSTLKE